MRIESNFQISINCLDKEYVLLLQNMEPRDLYIDCHGSYGN